MSEIIKIGVTKNHNQEIIEVTEINLIAGKICPPEEPAITIYFILFFKNYLFLYFS